MRLDLHPGIDMAKRSKRERSFLPDSFNLMQKESASASRLGESVDAIKALDLFGEFTTVDIPEDHSVIIMANLPIWAGARIDGR